MKFEKEKLTDRLRKLGWETTIIMLGVGIALAANGMMDGVHIRHRIEVAEEEMRMELVGDNGPQAFVRVAIAPCLDQAITRIHDAAETTAAPELRKMAHEYGPPFRTWDTEAWKALLTSDVTSHMNPSRLVDWSEPYRVLPLMTQWSQMESEWVTELQEGLPISGDLSREDVHQFQRTAASLRRVNAKLASKSRLVLIRMKKNGMTLSDETAADLLVQARQRYGACVREPVIDGDETESEFTNEAEMRREALGAS